MEVLTTCREARGRDNVTGNKQIISYQKYICIYACAISYFAILNRICDIKYLKKKKFKNHGAYSFGLFGRGGK